MNASLYCHDCGGDVHQGTCRCDCELCECGGCVSCGKHDRSCPLSVRVMAEPRALVVGLGRMGGFHRQVLGDLGFQVTTVDPAGHADATEIPEGRFDAIAICVPIPELAAEARRWQGFRGNLLVEKPFAASLEEARELAELLDGQRVAVGYVDRFNPEVRKLREWLVGRQATRARFIRWSDRPTDDLAVDVQAHDLDLARWLGIAEPVLDSKARARIKRREIGVVTEDGEVHLANLLAHDTSPLHALWHHFLRGGRDCAKPEDAIRVLEAVSVERREVAA